MKKRIKKYFILGSATLVIISLIRLLLVDLYFVPTSSMANTILPNSYLLVSKVSYGAKLPRSTDNLPYFSKLIGIFGKIMLWDDSRIHGFKKIERGDIALVELRHAPFRLIKRVIAVPGDTLIIQNGIAQVNFAREELRTSYRFKFSCVFKEEEAQSLRNKFRLVYRGKNEFEILLSGNTVAKFLNDFGDKILYSKYVNQDLVQSDTISPASLRGNWDRNHYGGLTIPRTGTVITLDKATVNLYRETIEGHENVKIEETRDGYRVNGILAEYYVFKNNYYFLLGDNRMDSKDSRFWGLFPEASFLGKVMFKD